MAFEFISENPAGENRTRMTVTDADVTYLVLFVGNEIGNVTKHSVISYSSPFGDMKLQQSKAVKRLVKGSKSLREFALKMHRT